MLSLLIGDLDRRLNHVHSSPMSTIVKAEELVRSSRSIGFAPICENLNVERQAAQSESSFNSNTVLPAPDVDENVNLDLSVGSESESEDKNMAVYDVDTEVEGGPDVDSVIDLDKDQQNYNSGECQKNTNGFPKLPRFAAQPGIKVALSDDPSPLEVYKLFITDELINSWKQGPTVAVDAAGSNCGNLSSCRRCGNFIVIYIHVDLDRKPTLHGYWTRHPVLHSSFAPKVMVRERLLSILAFVSINDNATFVPHGQPDHDTIQKIRSLVDHLNAQFKEMYQPQREVCIDEAMIPFKGRARFKVYMKDKPTK
ncbi:PiggyBac transposable element-derived protein 4 [Plakobranchus ocellatus]|uniref:PiggyBac transposable element-derived protein 4 n=1 Tax=Plakobranchus ocellatus TaxID=259542 RepID=A0AAV4AI75_9GAST|nr:PiggyBac transposable element-derived protein 4 [Plakobranchus ocellatus]